MYKCSYKKFLTMFCILFSVVVMNTHSVTASTESSDRYQLSSSYCELVVGENINIYMIDLKEDNEIPDKDVRLYTDSNDITIDDITDDGSGNVNAVKCSGKKKSYANVYAEYKGIRLQCEVVIYAKASYKEEFNIVLPKSIKYYRVGNKYKLDVNGAGDKKIEWYVGTGESCKDMTCKYARIDQKGRLTILKCREDPDELCVCAKKGKIRRFAYIRTQPVRNKKEKKELKKLLDKTSLSAKKKKKAMTHYNKYCYWDGSGHLEELYLTECGMKGKVSLKSFKHLKSIDLSDNSLGSIDITNNFGLTDVNLGNNKLSRLDISNNTNLKVLDVDSNRIENINFDNNKLLEKLHISLNPITKLDNLGVCSELTELKVDNDKWMYREGEYSWQDGYLEAPKEYDTLEMIDVSNNLKLKTLAADDNPNLKIVMLPNSSELDCLSVEYTGVSELDITKCTELSRLYLFGSNVRRVVVPKPYFKELSCNEDTVFINNDREYNYKEIKKASMESGMYYRFLFGNRGLFFWDTFLYGYPDEDDYEYVDDVEMDE